MDTKRIFSSAIFQFILWLVVVMGISGPLLWYYVPYEYDTETKAKITKRDTYWSRRNRSYRCTIQYTDKTGKVYEKQAVPCGCCENERIIYYNSKDPNQYSVSTKTGRFVGFLFMIFVAYLIIFGAIWIRLHPESVK